MKQKQLGQLPPQYDFFLNPYADLRFTRCPKCRAKIGQRKLPLVIWVDPHYPVSLNYTCRYCKNCDLLIAHRNEIENLLVQIFQQSNPQLIGNDYTVLGTMEKTAWKQGIQRPMEFQDMPAHLHEFNQVLKFELTSRPDHPLFGDIRAYQEERQRKLPKDYGAAGFTVKPRKRH